VDLEVFGTGLGRYEFGFAEGLGLLLAALSRDRISGTGPAFTFREVTLVPGPRTRPHPPLVVACTSRATAALAAACGLPMLLGMHTDDDGKREMITAYAAAAPSGQPPAGHMGAVVAYVANTREQAQRLLRRELSRWLAPGLAGYRPVDGQPRPVRDPQAYADLLCDIHPVGTAADCIDAMAATIERTGIRHLLCMVEGAGDPNGPGKTSPVSARKSCPCCASASAAGPVTRGRPRAPLGSARSQGRPEQSGPRRQPSGGRSPPGVPGPARGGPWRTSSATSGAEGGDRLLRLQRPGEAARRGGRKWPGG
jgi:hypothetical protein